jgi:hypothetical protein
VDEFHQVSCTGFAGPRLIASGALDDVASKSKELIDRGERAPILIFDDSTGELIDLDFRGTATDVIKRLTPASADPSKPRGPGRPKLGVVAREVTLLPRHWAWLNSQPGGASVALRKLVEEARRVHEGRDLVRQSQTVAYRFIAAMAGDRPGFEEATRALFAGSSVRFDEQVEDWPADIRAHAKKLAAAALLSPSSTA